MILLPVLVLSGTLGMLASHEEGILVFALGFIGGILLLSIGLTAMLEYLAANRNFLEGYVHYLALISIGLIAMVRKQVLGQIVGLGTALSGSLLALQENWGTLVTRLQFDPLSTAGLLTVIIAVGLIFWKLRGRNRNNGHIGEPGGKG